MKAAATVFMLLLCTAAGGLVQEWSTLSAPAIDHITKGVLYLLIAAVLALALWGLSRLKAPVPKRARKRGS